MFPKHSGDLKLGRKMIKLWQSKPPESSVALTPESVLGMACITAALQLLRVYVRVCLWDSMAFFVLGNVQLASGCNYK